MGVLWRRYVMLGVEGSIFNRSVIWFYIIKVIKIMLTFIAVTFIFIRNFIDLQGSDGFHKLLALVFMALQDPIAITALNPFYGWFGLQNLFLLYGLGIGSACACLPQPLAKT